MKNFLMVAVAAFLMISAPKGAQALTVDALEVTNTNAQAIPFPGIGDIGVFTFNFTLNPPTDNVAFDMSQSTRQITGTEPYIGFTYTILDPIGAIVQEDFSLVSLQSLTIAPVGSVVTVPQGSSAAFQGSIAFTPETSGLYQAQLLGVQVTNLGNGLPDTFVMLQPGGGLDGATKTGFVQLTVPEPSTLLFLGIGGLTLFAQRKRIN